MLVGVIVAERYTFPSLKNQIGYGGMMVGGQMNEEQTHETLNHAFDVAGMNWLDTSESFP